ncbi:hypothetical protein G647_03078 [Cladophialophora carrionii CBS 160.54]|uniref:Clr5 domain-containing protein n=1 Tax=Cladophialophora carrionii CBS 160.54 TaxID=1279043 RepID=V9DHY6_9EURO|nr:uncharacterized protein G647_03078 [Cladophialophora carrionii CBS 160.54]ETI26301.1 hypothetical protein G647_03078 [Cladophialophora carrionii CBS 160.54]
MDPATRPLFRPRTDSDWEVWRPLFTRLYKEENRPLPEVMRILRDQHSFWASEKMFKNRIKAWKLRKYLKEDEAKMIVEGEGPSTNGADPEDMRERAERSLKRKRARQRAQSQLSPLPTTTSPLPLPPSPTTSVVVPWGPPRQSIVLPPLDRFKITDTMERFLLDLRRWTHSAFIHGSWDSALSSQHNDGRQASRLLSSSLTAGINLFENGKHDLAFKEWDRALASFKNPRLFESWYYEIPMSLLHEVGRVAHSGHAPIASLVLRNVKDWAHKYLDPQDSRHALFSDFGDLDVRQLRELYKRAARSMFDGLESRIDKQNKLLFEVRLNRALDLLWYDPMADLSEWLPSIEEVDKAIGPNSALSVYFLLLQAYRDVAQDQHGEAEDLCNEVQSRLEELQKVPGSIDLWRVGLAYRRLGRMQHSKERYPEARRSFNTALRYVSGDSKLSRSVLIEICQRQQAMSSAMNDAGDVFLWTQMLEGLEQQTQAQVEEVEDDDEEFKPAMKKQRLPPSRTASPAPQRRGTWS